MVEVSAGIFIRNSKFLCFQKGTAKYPYLTNKWEFPGGKVEKGEDPKDTIVRELSEELRINISGQRIEHLCDTEYEYPDFHVLMHSFLIFVDDLEYTLTEHVDSQWHTLYELPSIDWAEADKLVVKKLEEYFAR